MILKKSSKQASHTTSCALRIHEREAGRKTSIADKFNGQTSLNVRKTNTQPSSAHKRTKQENKRSSYISVVNVVLAFDTRDRRRGCYIIPIPVPSVGGTGEGGMRTSKTFSQHRAEQGNHRCNLHVHGRRKEASGLKDQARARDSQMLPLQLRVSPATRSHPLSSLCCGWCPQQAT